MSCHEKEFLVANFNGGKEANNFLLARDFVVSDKKRGKPASQSRLVKMTNRLSLKVRRNIRDTGGTSEIHELQD